MIAITRTDLQAEPTVEVYQDVLTDMGFVLPLLLADPRSKDDVLILLDMLMSVVEMNQATNIDIKEPDHHEYNDPLLSL